MFQKIKSSAFFVRWGHWEYWPFWLTYLPVFPYYAWLSLKAKTPFFFSAANPGIDNGGFLMERKSAIDALLPAAFKAKTLAFRAGCDPRFVASSIVSAGLSYPLIVKPDSGARGRGVKKIADEKTLLEVVPRYDLDFVIQPFIELPNEVGIFYVRYPDQSRGQITGIVGKEFMKVTGNGADTIAALIEQVPRYRLQLPALRTILPPETMRSVLPASETCTLLPYGNHARGCLFLDLSDRIDDQLTRTIDDLCNQIPRFYFGRLDIRYADWESLRNGKDFCVIELNGAGSEPTHIYDPSHSLFFAWKEIFRHLNLLYRIAKRNHRFGHRYLSWREGVKLYTDNKNNETALDALVV